MKKYKGVYFDKRYKNWRAIITTNDGIKKHLGTFEKQIDAVKIYDRALLHYYGDSARVHFPNKLKEYLDDPYLPNKAVPRKTGNSYLGVCWNRHKNRWHAYITINGKRKNLGLFVYEEDAARKRDQVAMQFHDNKTKLNFPIG